MKEMVSWRGVAKKRRKQEAGGVVNQMFAYCCGHATIVARRQPLFGLICSRCTAHCGQTSPLEASGESPVTTSERSTTEFLQRENRLARHRATRPNLGTARALPRIGQHDSQTFAAPDLAIARHRALRSYDASNPSRSKGIASFLCGRHFLRAFSSRDDAARDTRADNGLIFHTQDRTTSCAICRRRF
jgi:hypothetical protein